MSFHTVTMLMRWVMTARGDSDYKIQAIRRIPYESRVDSELLKNTVNAIKEQWARGSKIEKLALLGTTEQEFYKLFSDILENYESLKAQFKQHASIYGAPSDISDSNLNLYENTVLEEIKKL